MTETIRIIALKLCSTEGSGMISANSFCGLILTRAIDMNLDPSFLYNLLSKNDSDDSSETVEFFHKVLT